MGAAYSDVVSIETAADGLTSRWTVIDDSPVGASIANLVDTALGSRVIELDGAGYANAYRIGGTHPVNGWHDTDNTVVSWRLQTAERFGVFVAISTTNGFRYAYYDDNESDQGFYNNLYLHYGLGAATTDGNWRTVTRDLAADVAAAESGNALVAIHGIVVRGNLRLDDVLLTDAVPANTPPTAIAGGDVSIELGQSATLDASASTDTDGFISTLRWADANGTTLAESAQLTWTPPSAGDHTLTLTVTDDDGAIATDTLLVSVSDPTPPTIHYEDAEDGLTGRWAVIDDSPAGASVANLDDTTLGSRVIELDGAGFANAYRIGGTNAGSGWNDTTHTVISWRLQTTERFGVFVAISTTNGFRYAYYDDSESDQGFYNNLYLHYGLGANTTDGNWRTVTRDLAADVAAAEPGNALVAIHGIVVRGNLRLDDVLLTDAIPPNTPPTAIAGGDVGIELGQSVTLDASASFDVDGFISSLRWRDATGKLITESALFSWTPPSAGIHAPTLTVTDDDGAIGTDTLTVTVDAATFEPRPIEIGSAAGDMIELIDDLAVSTSQLNVQQSPVDIADGYVYTANIEHGPNGDSDDVSLRTIIRQGFQNPDGSWTWSQALIEDRTVNDEWHTAPSVAVDPDGFVHVAYNMHNFPWQYKRSSQAHDINAFDFKGQFISLYELERHKFENKTTFPDLGTADIPGNQITYPAFFKDNNGRLHVSYRMAARPARSFSDRTMSSAIAVYDETSRQWQAIGAPLNIDSGDYQAHQDAPDTPTIMAGKIGWTSYHPRLMFGPSNELHVNWFWRQGIAGAQLSRPCYMKTYDGQTFFDANDNAVSLPATPEDCGNIGNYSNSFEFYSIGNSTIDSAGNPAVLLSPEDGTTRQIWHLDTATGNWSNENSPSNATEIFYDANDNLWAVRKGPSIFRKSAGSSTWETLHSSSSNAHCYPKAKLDRSKSIAIIHTQSCDATTVSVFALRLL